MNLRERIVRVHRDLQEMKKPYRLPKKKADRECVKAERCLRERRLLHLAGVLLLQGDHNCVDGIELTVHELMHWEVSA